MAWMSRRTIGRLFLHPTVTGEGKAWYRPGGHTCRYMRCCVLLLESNREEFSLITQLPRETV